MLHVRKALFLILAALLLVQPVFAETEPDPAPTLSAEPDLISAIHTVAQLPSNWSPLSPVTDERQFLLELTTTPVYAFQEDGTWLPLLAQALPEDVTAAYAGTYGIPASAQGSYAYRIQLNPDACWEDGLSITADDYLFSIGKLLEDEENRSNWDFLANAREILSGKKKSGEEVISLRQAQLFNVREALAAGYTDLFVDAGHFWGLDAGWLPVSDRSRLQDFAMPDGMDERFVSAEYLYTRYLAEDAESSRFQSSFIGIRKPSADPMTMEDLGVLKISSHELVFILRDPAAPSTLMQKLEKLFLFRQSCWSNAFATSPETYCGYGPYRITASEPLRIILEPNPNWWVNAADDDFDRIICRTDGKD